MKMRGARRVLCLILAFLMLTGTAEPVFAVSAAGVPAAGAVETAPGAVKRKPVAVKAVPYQGRQTAEPAETEDGETLPSRTVYLALNDAWLEGLSRYAAVVTAADGEDWIEPEAQQEEGRIAFQLPGDMRSFRFVRLDARQPLNEWEYVLNRTEELTLPEDETMELFTLYGEGQELRTGESGEWRVWEEPDPAPEEQSEENSEESEPEEYPAVSDTDGEEPEEQSEESREESEPEEPSVSDTDGEAPEEQSREESEPEEPSASDTDGEAPEEQSEEDSEEGVLAEPAAAEGEQEPSDPASEGSDEGGSSNGGNSNPPANPEPLQTGYTALQGSVEFNDIPFTGILRPKTFNQTLAVVPVYRVGDNLVDAPAWSTQSISTSAPCFLQIFAEGDGTAGFAIGNVPRTVKVEGVEYNVAKYRVTVPDPQPSFYEQTDLDQATTDGSKDLTVYLTTKKCAMMTLSSEVFPFDPADDTIFSWRISFTLPDGVAVDAEENEFSEVVHTTHYVGNKAILELPNMIPAGIRYTVEQLPSDGYRMETGEAQASWSGITSEEGFTVTCVNHPIHLRLPFIVNWIDNNSLTRPTNYKDMFKLQVKRSGKEEEWTDYPGDPEKLEQLYGITTPSVLKVEGNHYTFPDLPGVDLENRLLEYRVVCTAPDSYAIDKETAGRDDVVTLSHCHAFSAAVQWRDDNDSEHLRPVMPNLPDLRLYSRDGDGKVEEIIGDRSTWQWTQEDNLWRVTVPNLPTYQQDNREIEYYLVYGTDDGNGEVTSATLPVGNMLYTPFYNNGTSSYAAVEHRCHAGGTITMLLSSSTVFSADVVWKDMGDAEAIAQRPSVTVTVWRYANQDKPLDQAFQEELTSMVVFLDEDKQEHPLSFTLPEGSQNARVTTDANGITVTYQDKDGNEHSESHPCILPGHDGAGQKYTYFLRETLTGANRNHYSVDYTQGTKSYSEGAPDNGTVTNTRREKAMVTVDKTWRNPEGLEQIAGAKVRLALYAKQGENGTPEPLQVYGSEDGSYEILTGKELIDAQTAEGFTATIPTAQKSYYVNLFDHEGKPYDMTEACLVEEVTLSGSDRSVTQHGSTITVGGDSYAVTTGYDSQRSDIEGTPKRYHYNQVNTVKATREYEIEKVWSLKKEESRKLLESIQAVEVRLERCLVKDLNKSSIPWETVEQSVYLTKDSAGKWVRMVSGLDKYNQDGNAYYYSASETGFLVADGASLPSGISATTVQVGGQNRTRISVSDVNNVLGWSQAYNRTDAKTTVSNVDGVGSGFFSVTKNWKDNNDTLNRPSITIRFYDRGALYAAVQGKTGNVNWGKLDDLVTPITPQDDKEDFTVLNSANGFSVSPTYLSLCGRNEEIAKRKSMSDYVVLEYKLGEGNQTPASYTYEQLAAISASASAGEVGTSAAGTVHYDDADDAKDRSYNVTNIRSTARDTFYILNERTGKTSLTLEKAWNDENNRLGLRPAQISFQLYRDGALCTDLDGVVFGINQDNVTVTPEQTEEGHFTGTFTAAYSGTGGNTASQWSITVSNLPMFSDDSGMLYAYNIDEKNTLVGSSDEQVHYVQSRGLVETSQLGATQHFNVPMTNTVVGITSHTAFKYWKDAAVDKSLRPELILTLYRYIRSEAQELNLPKEMTFDDLNALTPEQQNQVGFEKVPSYHDPVMTAGDGVKQGASGKPYDWLIEIDDLQRFDTQGREYVYVLREQVTNDGVTVRGTYEGKTVRKGECDEFTNTIRAKLTMSGAKTWKGHESYTITVEELPDPWITLYRTTDAELSTRTDLNQLTDQELQAALGDGRLVEVDKIELIGAHKNGYAFPSEEKVLEARTNGVAPPYMVMEGTTPMLPQYDDEGQRYVYLMRETLPGEIMERIYSKTSASGTLVNTLLPDINRRTITVHKKWKGREEAEAEGIKEYHSLTFYLYRFLQEKGAETAVPYRSETVSAEKLKLSDGKCEVHFQDLLVFSPNGKAYGYYVTEQAMDGYETILTWEDSDTPDQFKDMAHAAELAFTDTAGWDTPNGIQNDIYVHNTYQPKAHQISLNGIKVWNDWQDEAGVRPESIFVKVYRSTRNETNQNNAISKPDGVDSSVWAIDPTVWDGNGSVPDGAWIKWSKSGEQDALGRDKWTYQIGGLPRYAPNGMPYIYTVREDRTDSRNQVLENTYTSSGSVSTAGKTLSADNSYAMDPLTNSLTKSYRFRKFWQDGSNIYHLRPEDITVVLQYSVDGGAHWQDVPYQQRYQLTGGVGVSARWFAYTEQTQSHTNALAVTLTAAKDAVPNTGNNTWDYTFSNLPARRKVGTEVKDVTYRCIEVKVGKAVVDYTRHPLEQGEGEYKVGAYKAVYRSIDSNATAVQNMLDSSNLKVTKVWFGDQDNRYESRPASLTFKLQRKGYTVTDTGSSLREWADVEVPGPGGSMVPYTFTVTEADGWSRTLEDLPVSGTDEGGTQFYQMEYRAVELHDPDSSLASKGALNYEDQTDYDTDGGHTFYPTAEQEKNTSTLLNRLVTLDMTISANKIWYASDNRADGNVKATFELQYRVVGTETWNSYATPLKQTISKTVNGEQSSVEWRGLPKYDREGNELEYRIIEEPIDGYCTTLEVVAFYGNSDFNGGGDMDDLDAGGNLDGGGDMDDLDAGEDTGSIATPELIVGYVFTNIEMQDYTVHKHWSKPGVDANDQAYVPDDNGSFTATFVLQQKTGSGEWTDCTPPVSSENAIQTLTGDASYTWHNLPRYTEAGAEITYRAVENRINGNAVEDSTDGNYIVTYDYDGTGENKQEPAFCDTRTDADNRLVYGFVNLSKEAAYLSPDPTGVNTDLSGVEFKILDADGKDYATGILTDSNGNLQRNPDGTYGTQHRYLIPGQYTLVEVSTPHSDYSIWDRGVPFTVGLHGGTADTGEHGTAWISTVNELFGLSLQVSYKAPTAAGHSFSDGCAPAGTDTEPAYNLESRGVIAFTKKGADGAALDTHEGASGESKAYFGVYTDAECTKQVAGMSAANGTDFVLTDKGASGDTLTKPENAAHIPYLRSYSVTGFTLLSGTYYVKELVPPAGCKLDTAVRSVTIPKLEKTAMVGDLTEVYAQNRGVFADGGVADYQWENSPNRVTIYKMDQFGRKVALAPGGYLELTFDGAGNTFSTGENILRLYQDTAKPARKTDGSTRAGGESGKWSVTYGDGAWTITGLFDAGKQYTLSEPAAAVPADNITARPLTFTIGGDGKMTVSHTDTHAVQKASGVTSASGAENDYKNYYRSAEEGNTIVFRDVARFRKNVVLKKVVNGTVTHIPNISFQLYHGRPTDTSPALVTDADVMLTTDGNGIIDLSKLDDGVTNRITGAPLKNGLDLGDYFFREVERGASDQYRLAGDISFSISAVVGNGDDYESYAEVTFQTASTKGSAVTQTEDQGTVSNTPVSGKTLELTKQDTDGTTLLEGARFRLEYVSVTDGDTGSLTSGTAMVKEYTTNAQGRLVDGTGAAPDISAKGTYTLTELQAPGQHRTYTVSGTAATPPMLRFTVNSDNEIVVANGSSYVANALTGTGLVTAPQVTGGSEGDLTVTVYNPKTVLTLRKRNDLSSSVKTKNQQNLSGEPLTGAELEIYTGTAATGTPITTLNGETSDWTVNGVLSENTVYTLHEKTAPVGFLPAEDIYFCLFGTRATGVGISTESQLYVWTGSTAPETGTLTPADLTASGSKWSQSRNLDDNNDLTMVDEAVIAPVDARKVLKTGEAYTALKDVTFDVRVNGGVKLGTVVSGADGYLTWQSLTADALNSLVYNSDGKRITAAADAVGQGVILRQNTEGYTFTETYAPDNAYNEGIGLSKVYRVAVTAQNYQDYKARPDDAIDLVAASRSADYTASLTARRETLTEADLVNPAYHATVTLHKYDSDPEGNQAAIPGTQFTLKRGGAPYTKASVTGGSVQADGVFTTDANGNLSVTIPEKGSYTLTETGAAPGYKLDTDNTFRFTLADKSGEGQFGYDTTNELKRDETGVPNARQYGVITLTKNDEHSHKALNGVAYTLSRTDKNTPYFAAEPQIVTTGHAYLASYSSDTQKWTLAESAGEGGAITVSGLNWGTYALTETTELSGYGLDMTKAEQSAAHTKTYTVASGSASVDEVLYPATQTDTNTKNAVTFRKTDNAVTPKGLAGAVFEVHNGSGEKIPFYLSPNAADPVTRVTSGEDGRVTVYGLPTDPASDTPVSYRLVEVTAPEGYVLNPTPVEFTLDRKGNVRLSNAIVSEVAMADKPILVTLQKLGESGDTLLNGAEFTLTPQSGSRFVDSETSKSLTLTNGTMLIPVETLIGGHSYTLTETKAPDGYEATAVVHFTVGTDGRVTVTGTTGGHGTLCCVARNEKQSPGGAEEYQSTLSIRDELIRVTLTKVDSGDPSVKLAGVTYQLTPYGGGHFTPDFTDSGLTGNVFTATTDANGVLSFPDGLLVHSCQYLLRETSIPDSLRYYLGKEAGEGVILSVAENGSITVERLSAYQGKTAGGGSSCPVTAQHNGDGTVSLTAKNPKAAVFRFTKAVSGNMGDLSGSFRITMKVYEPDGTWIDTKEVVLRNGEGYSSEQGKLDASGTVIDQSCKFGSNAIPVGATLKLIEDADEDYEAVIHVEGLSGAALLAKQEKGSVSLLLDHDITTANPATFTLTNRKEVAIDVGVTLEQNGVYALTALLIPSAWLYLRTRRRKKEGDDV